MDRNSLILLQTRIFYKADTLQEDLATEYTTIWQNLCAMLIYIVAMHYKDKLLYQ